LGLSIVRNIIEKHHSRVYLVSEVGIGTTFWFDLEVAEESQSPLAEPSQGDILPTAQASPQVTSTP
jgi:two-component system sensor histidine kinase NblS